MHTYIQLLERKTRHDVRRGAPLLFYSHAVVAEAVAAAFVSGLCAAVSAALGGLPSPYFVELLSHESRSSSSFGKGKRLPGRLFGLDAAFHSLAEY